MTDTKDVSPAQGGLLRRLSLERWQIAAVDLYRWWRQELYGMVPSRLRRWAVVPPLLVEASASELRLRDPQRGDREWLLPLIDPDTQDNAARHSSPAKSHPTRCLVVLNSELGLETPLSLPAEAEANLRGVIGFSMDRYTPFKEEDVYYGYHVLGRDRQNGKINLMLYVVPRAILDQIVRTLSLAGIEVVEADIVDSQTETSKTRAGINLLPGKEISGTILQRRINEMLAVTALLMMLAVLIIPLIQRQQQVNALEKELAGLKASVQEAERLRSDVTARSDTLRKILQYRNTTAPVLEVLRELTRLTPDDAWAGQVEIKNGRVRLTGEAEAGSELLQALTSSAYFSDPRFEAPLTENPKSGKERFVISLAIRSKTDEP